MDTKVIRINLNKERNEIVGDIKVIVIADSHIGDRNANVKYLKEIIDMVLREPNTYIIINGDICNMALKNSKSNIYDDIMGPEEQLEFAYQLLYPVRHKILCMHPGNHDERPERETGIDVIKFLAHKLGIIDRYSKFGWFLFLQFGNCKRGRPIIYEAYGYHGSGGCGTSGAKLNKVKSLRSIVVADLYVMSHVHDVNVNRSPIIVADKASKTLVQRTQHFLTTNSFVEYGGYASKAGYPASSILIAEISFSSKQKLIRVTI